MELNHEALDKALCAFNLHPGDQKSSFIVAIKTYLTEMFKPMGPMIVGEAIPQRDYRKEAWIAALTTGNGAPWADQALAHFDATFSQEKPHG